VSTDTPNVLDAFKRHGLLGLITGAHLILIFYLISTFNDTIRDNTVAMRELKAAIERIAK
jgi:hypothetical protein